MLGRGRLRQRIEFGLGKLSEFDDSSLYSEGHQYGSKIYAIGGGQPPSAIKQSITII